jgi:hypothetical protein
MPAAVPARAALVKSRRLNGLDMDKSSEEGFVDGPGPTLIVGSSWSGHKSWEPASRVERKALPHRVSRMG